MEKPNFPECHEGPDAAARFEEEVRFLLSVPHTALFRRENARQTKAGNQNRHPSLQVKNSEGLSPAQER
jgi:hypothetical protein